ncbi:MULTISPECIES: hypothetical protein [unclassified Rhizobium]|uniref:hypothetical protein n=1 Tax=unclassified Rhizobium TaxID=2613769 RepID=UPI00161D8ACC|nr:MULTISPECIES: hypothetical protein [unclassified Rhizobium]MBB3544347.1 hypothetical protein [Rhizobium sp. BK399]MCS3742810.1 hypothetical protein [Rhizobium sp. BK661]
MPYYLVTQTRLVLADSETEAAERAFLDMLQDTPSAFEVKPNDVIAHHVRLWGGQKRALIDAAKAREGLRVATTDDQEQSIKAETARPEEIGEPSFHDQPPTDSDETPRPIGIARRFQKLLRLIRP